MAEQLERIINAVNARNLTALAATSVACYVVAFDANYAT